MNGATVATLLLAGAITTERCRKTLRHLGTRAEYDAMLRAMPDEHRAFVQESTAAAAAAKFGA